MRLIDADALDDAFIRLNADEWQLTRGDHDRMEAVLFEMPTIDAVPVVRCRDCTLSREDGFFCTSTFHGGMTFPNDFCSNGERKDGDGDAI